MTPTPEQQTQFSRPMGPDFARRLFDIPDAPDLAHEVAELRKEIAALRAELTQVPSLILTGRQVLDEFKRMKGNV